MKTRKRIEEILLKGEAELRDLARVSDAPAYDMLEEFLDIKRRVFFELSLDFKVRRCDRVYSPDLLMPGSPVLVFYNGESIGHLFTEKEIDSLGCNVNVNNTDRLTRLLKTKANWEVCTRHDGSLLAEFEIPMTTQGAFEGYKPTRCFVGVGKTEDEAMINALQAKHDWETGKVEEED